MNRWVVSLVAVISTRIVSGYGYEIQIIGDGNIVQGGTAHFKAEVFDENGHTSSGLFRYFWEDNAIPNHNAMFESSSPVSNWSITFNSSYFPGQYNVEVQVEKRYLIYLPIGRNAMFVNVTSLLNGEINLHQNKVLRKKYVSNASPVNHQITLSNSDEDFLNRSRNVIKSYWFVDCVYYGVQSGLNFEFNYTQPELPHYVETIVIASTAPVIPTTTTTSTTTPAPPTTTKKPNTTTTTTTTTTASTTTAAATTTTTTTTVNTTDTNEISQFGDLDQPFKDWLLNFTQKNRTGLGSSKFCINPSSIPFNHNNTYGYFQSFLTVKAPIKVAPINGTNWLMDGEVLNITIACNGSSPFVYCTQKKTGLYNVTGNETCSHEEEKIIRDCNFGIQHLFKEPLDEYTFVVIISNTVSRVVKPIAVNIYKVTKRAQLSVVIVPVTFSIVAIILIIFGVAYYLQSKRTYTIEVADFDFGNQTSDMEYKSFRERLRESVSNSFLKSQDLPDNEVVWSPSRKYGSMQ